MGRNMIVTQLGAELVKVRKKCRNEFETVLLESANSAQGPAVSIVYNLVGANSRVNSGTIDASTNTISVSDTQLFSDLRRAIMEIAEESARQRLLSEADALQSQTEKQGRGSAYLNFIKHAANHITILTPFLPALAQWAQG